MSSQNIMNLAFHLISQSLDLLKIINREGCTTDDKKIGTGSLIGIIIGCIGAVMIIVI